MDTLRGHKSQTIRVARVKSVAQTGTVEICRCLCGPSAGCVSRFRSQERRFSSLRTGVERGVSARRGLSVFSGVITRSRGLGRVFFEGLIPTVSGKSGRTDRRFTRRTNSVRLTAIRLLSRLRGVIGRRQTRTIGTAGRDRLRAFGALVVSVLTTIVVKTLVALLVDQVMSHGLGRIIDVAGHVTGKRLSIPRVRCGKGSRVNRLTRTMGTVDRGLQVAVRRICRMSRAIDDRDRRLSRSTRRIGTKSRRITSAVRRLTSNSRTRTARTSGLSSFVRAFSSGVRRIDSDKRTIFRSSEGIVRVARGNDRLVSTSVRRVNVVSAVIRSNMRGVGNLSTRSRRVSGLMSIVGSVTSRAGLLTLGTTVRTTQTNRRNHKFTIITSRMEGLTRRIAMSMRSVANVISDVRGRSTGITSSLGNNCRRIRGNADRVGAANRAFARVDATVGRVTNDVRSVARGVRAVTKGDRRVKTTVRRVTSISRRTTTKVRRASTSSRRADDDVRRISEDSRRLSRVTRRLGQLIKEFGLW